MSLKRNITGRAGEDAAAEFLRRKGHKILEQNFRTRAGEIDLITEDRDTIVFIEVKTRQSDSHGSPFESVTSAKQRQIGKVALEYISRHDRHDSSARFDVIAIYFETTGPRIEHLENAFELQRWS